MIVRKLITMIAFQVNKRGLNTATSATSRIKQALGGIGGASASAGASFSRSAAAMSASASRVTSGLSQIKSSLSGIAGSLGPIAGAMAAAFSVSAIKSAADDMMNLDGRLRTVTADEQERFDVEQQLYEMSMQNRQSLDSMGDLYYKVARAAQRFGVSQEDSMRVTDVVSKALTVGGASAQEASATILQLGQALSSGVLQGDELHSLDENASLLMQHVADNMGVTIGQLKQMGSQGQLTSEKVIQAILQSGDAIDKEFGQMPMTIGQAQTKIENDWKYFIQKVENDTGAFSRIASSIDQTFGELFEDLYDFEYLLTAPADERSSDQFKQMQEAHPFLARAAEDLQIIVEKMSYLADSTGIDNLIMKAALAAGAIAAIGGVLAIVGSAVSAVIGVFSGLFSIVSGVAGFILSASWPVIAAIAAVAAAIYFVKENWDTLITWFQPGLALMQAGLELLANAWNDICPFIEKELPLLEAVANLVGGVIVGALTVLLTVASGVFATIALLIRGVAAGLEQVAEFIQWCADGLNTLIDKAKEFLGMSGELNAHNSALERMTSNAYSYSMTQSNTFSGYSAEDAGSTANYLLGGGQTQFFPYG
uniref:Tail length tape measure protein n=1 Tax=Myoviridae sp. ct17M4 TaxID=2825016 RepID=A0A8S5TVB2_9CAUD|nr:MAG TPA: tail length tape measure protein [Myoviridae sp. ct17M4]